jgi:hypothetical protein
VSDTIGPHRVRTRSGLSLNYRRLGRSELVVSVVGFGTTQLRRVPETHRGSALPFLEIPDVPEEGRS